ncbi:hypothetical protein CY34DRAFT_193790 [Suillus luteus UH-Slu-Lm8-n1]|uniref:Uncharacterized protein n=1 Tax=Suillus luteus UH-Slu-Lm8-n1 TaxID=930992 RepID=A0A0D0ABU5_9AGAM|nr:hypothetical protein CY34DRAFT_193790 [Suillus luteus UH-Slu-Lm8-n1]
MKSYRRQGLSWCQSRDPPWIIFGVFFCLTCSGGFLTSDSPVNFEVVPVSQVVKSRTQTAETHAFAGAATAVFIYKAEVSATAKRGSTPLLCPHQRAWQRFMTLKQQRRREQLQKKNAMWAQIIMKGQ